MIGLPQAVAITAFVASCVGLGFLAELWVLGHRWPEWVSGLMSAAVVFLWPVALVGYFAYDGAPPLLVMSMSTVGTAVLALLGTPLARLGAFIARRRMSKTALRCSPPPDNGVHSTANYVLDHESS